MRNYARLFSVDIKDTGKGAILAFITVVVTLLYKSIESGIFPVTWVEWKVILLSGLGAFLAYILKNFLTNSKDKFLTKEKK